MTLREACYGAAALTLPSRAANEPSFRSDPHSLRLILQAALDIIDDLEEDDF
jgi:hypothetical protein